MEEFRLINPITDEQRKRLEDADTETLQNRLQLINGLLFTHYYGSNTQFSSEQALALYSERNYIRKELHNRRDS